MSEFFKAGGFVMYPTLLFGFLSVAAGMVFLLRPERRYVALLVSLGVTTAVSGLLGFVLGLMSTARYQAHLPEAEKLSVAMMGLEESLHPVILALLLVVVTALLASAGSFRAMRAARLPPAAA